MSTPRADAQAHLASALRRLHERAGSPTTRDVAATAGNLSHTTVADTLSGRTVPSWKTLQRLISALGGDSADFRDLWLEASEHSGKAGRTQAAFDQFIRDYRSATSLRFSVLDAPLSGRSSRMLLDDVYLLPDIYRSSESWSQEGALLTPERVIYGSTRAVILGEPGSGKTTFLGRVASLAAKDVAAPVPVFVSLRRVDTRHGHAKLLDVLSDHVTDSTLVAPPSGLLRRLAESGQLLVLFDGLDELLEPSQRSWISEQIELLAREYPLARLIVTSRPVGYGVVQLDPNTFEHYTIGRLTPEQVYTYVRTRQRVGASTETSGGRWEDLLNTLKQAGDTVSNPLLLASICDLWLTRGVVPTSKLALYEELTRIMLQDWDSSRGLRRAPPEAQAVLEFSLRAIALWSLMNFSGEGFPLDVAQTMVGRRLQQVVEPDEADRLSRQVIQDLMGRDSMLVTVGRWTGGSMLAFRHRVFQDYLAALEIAAPAAKPEDLADMLVELLRHRHVHPAALLAVSLIDRRFHGGAERMLGRLLIRMHEASGDERQALEDFWERAEHEPELMSVAREVVLQESLGHPDRAADAEASVHGSDPVSPALDVANALAERALNLIEAGRTEEAVSTMHEVVEIQRRSREAGFPGSSASLADSLSRLSNKLRGMYLQQDALIALSEAVEVQRLLAREDPASPHEYRNHPS